MSCSKSSARIALIQMPFAFTAWPSLGLSQLKAILAKDGHSVSVHYFNKAFSRRIGSDLYDKIANGAPQNTDLFGEWIFSTCLWGRDARRDTAYIAEVLKGGHPAHAKARDGFRVDELARSIDELLPQADAFLDRCLDEVDWTVVDIVGFTSVFQQHLAALALAARLKARHPSLVILFGGANCEAEMGLATLEAFPFVDAICTGEGDIAFPEFVRSLREDTSRLVSGICTRAELSAGASRQETRGNVDLNSQPYPDFDDFFEDAPIDDDAYAARHRLIFESSRGCWWGQKHHCTFCGLNGASMRFRQKSGKRATEELTYLVERYGRFTRQVTATDNIMPLDYFGDFLPQLAASGLKLDLFYETKANLRKSQLKMYKDAGLTVIQPGIESLSSDVLKLMRKGITALQNIQLLKWCREFDIAAKWNFLAGFPGEAPSSYATIDALARKLTHLTPPIGVSRLRFDRFSPYHADPKSHGIARLRPYPAYDAIYHGLEGSTVARLAYYFTADYPEAHAIADYTAAAFRELRRWKAYAEQSALFHIDVGDQTIVYDLREDQARTLRLTGSLHAIFTRCDGILGREAFDGWDATTIDAALATLVDHGLFLQEEDRYLNISIPLDSDYDPPRQALQKLDLQFREPGARGNQTTVEIVAPRGGVLTLTEPPFCGEPTYDNAGATY